MLSLSSLIDFLLGLLRDEEAQEEFARDPQGVLARHDLAGVTAQDIRDVEPMLADCDGVSYRAPAAADHAGGYGPRGLGGDDDPVRVIQYVTRSHTVEREVVREDGGGSHTTQNIEYKQYTNEFSYTDNSVYVEEGGTYIRDSFNQDNDGVDNKGGIIADSTVVNGDGNTAGNSTEVTVVEDSFNSDESETVVIVDSLNDASDNSTTVTGSGNESTTAVYDSYAVNEPAATAAAVDAEPVPDAVGA